MSEELEQGLVVEAGADAPDEEAQSLEEGVQGVVVRCSPQLNGAQRRYLRGLGHHLEPTVLLGEKGLHDGVVTQVRRELLAHELVKVRWRGADPSARAEAAQRLHEEAGAQVVQVLGMTILLYKAHPERPKIELPRKQKAAGKGGARGATKARAKGAPKGAAKGPARGAAKGTINGSGKGSGKGSGRGPGKR